MDMNFLTTNYKNRIKLEEYARKCFALLSAIVILSYVLNFALTNIKNGVQTRINSEKIKNDKLIKFNKNLVLKSKKDKSLKKKIDFLKKNVLNRTIITKIFGSFVGNVDKNILIKNIIYQNDEVRINGIAYRKNAKTSSEESVYKFEEKMLANPLYSEIILNYQKQSTAHDDATQFDYTLLIDKYSL